MKRIFLFGRHAHRTPFAYPAYRDYFRKRFVFVNEPKYADFLVVGFLADLRHNPGEILQSLERNTELRIVVLSEEPLWDSMWSGDFTCRQSALSLAGREVSYSALNHCTSQIFEHRSIPYFVTTDDDFFVRYSYFFRRNAGLAASAILAHWRAVKWRAAFYCEKRDEARFDVRCRKHNLIGLSRYRSQIATGCKDERVRLVGKGFGRETARQSLPDWHLDKLSALDRNVFLVSGLENTHHPTYITEKIFDAYAVLGMPIYYAGPTHRIHNLLPAGSFLNVYDIAVDEAVSFLRSVESTDADIDAYQSAQAKLAGMFCDSGACHEERARVAKAINEEFDQILDSVREVESSG